MKLVSVLYLLVWVVAGVSMIFILGCSHQPQSQQFYAARAECSAVAGNAGGVTPLGRSGLSILAYSDCMRGKGY